MSNDSLKSLLNKSKSPGTSFGELAGIYLSGGRKKDNRARNILLASLFFNAKEAKMQSEAMKSIESLNESRKLDQLKLDDRLKQREKLLIDEEGYNE